MNILRLAILPVAIMILAGCDRRERELEMQNAILQNDLDSISTAMRNRAEYFDEVVEAINQVHLKLEGARTAGEEIRLQTEGHEGGFSLTNDQSRKELLGQIELIDVALDESRSEIARLETSVGTMKRESSGLNTLINNLKEQLEERERQFAALQLTVAGLENELAHQSRTIVRQDSIITSRETQLNTVYYIVGTRNELKELGVITDEGGFLWGLLGSTSVMSGSIDEALFSELDKTRDSFLSVEGEIEEILPRRDENHYVAEVEESGSNIMILDPAQFWKERYLVIVRG